MLFLDVEKDGVLGWQDWRAFDFGESNWSHDEPANWKPDYHGDALFLKIHRPPQALPDPRLNWENPFAFYDTDGDGLTEMAMRWLDPMTPVEKGVSPVSVMPPGLLDTLSLEEIADLFAFLEEGAAPAGAESPDGGTLR